MAAETMALRIRELLRPRLGTPMVEQTMLCPRLANVFAEYAASGPVFGEMREAAEAVLFDECYNALGESMHVRLDDGRETRIWLRMLPDLADEAMGALFEELPVYSATYRSLMNYMVSSGSYSALRVLYQQYRKFLSDEDYAELQRVMRERYPEEGARDHAAE